VHRPGTCASKTERHLGTRGAPMATVTTHRREAWAGISAGVLGVVGATGLLLLPVGAAVAAAGGPALDGAGAHALLDVLRPLFALTTFLFIVRIPMTWYPRWVRLRPSSIVDPAGCVWRGCGMLCENARVSWGGVRRLQVHSGGGSAGGRCFY
jgi:hypothetical protein